MTTYRSSPITGTPADVALRPFRTPVRGHPFAARPPGAETPHAGQPVRLDREPDNPADPLAVAVWTDEARCWRVGYLDRQVAARLAPRLDGGFAVNARIDGWVAEPQGRWRRPVVLLLPEAPEPALQRRLVPTFPVPSTSPPALAAEDRPSTGLWGRPPGVVVRPVGERRRRR